MTPETSNVDDNLPDLSLFSLYLMPLGFGVKGAAGSEDSGKKP